MYSGVYYSSGEISIPSLLKEMAWRSWDRPLVGTIYRLPDDLSLQRGITYTILPDGRSLRVPAMNRLIVRSQAQSHQDDEGSDIVQALQNLIKGRAPTRGQARYNKHCVAGRINGPRRVLGGVAPLDPAEGGLRPVMEGGNRLADA